MPWWLIPAILTVLLAGALTLSVVLDWFKGNKTSTSAYGTLIKERLANGNYKVVGGIFNAYGTRTATREWETSELDDELKAYFRSGDSARIEL